MRLTMTSIKFKDKTQLWVRNTDWDKIFNDEVYTTKFCKNFKELIHNGISYDEFNDCINAAGKQTATASENKCEGWFWYSRETPRPIIVEKNHLLQSIKNTKGLTQELKREMEAELDRKQ